MSPSRWQRVKELHADAIELPPERRRAFLEEQCAGDDELFREVLALLETEAEDEFLVAPLPAVGEGGVGAGPGRVLGEFELLEELGSGGSGVVYRASQASLSREVAVKVLPRHATLGRAQVERFQREARAAAKLRHPGIVPIYAVGQADGTHYFAMELVEGHDLHRELDRLRGLSEEEPILPEPDSGEYFRVVARLVAACGDALHFAHEHEVVHRDVKPHNVLLDGEGRPRIVDFGLAKDETLGSISRTGMIEGTPYYMSPEQAQAERGRVDRRTDIYSLGVVLYELLTLSRPFEGRTSHEVLEKITFREAKPVRRLNPAVPRDLAVICGKAMEKEPELRYHAASAFAEDLRRFATGRPIVATPPSIARRCARVARQGRTQLLVVAAVFLAVWGTVKFQDTVEARSWPSVSVGTQPERFELGGRQVPAVVFARRLDPVTGAVGKAVELGKAPLATEVLEPGYWRIVVGVEGFGFAELDRYLPEDATNHELTAWIRPDEEVQRGMIPYATEGQTKEWVRGDGGGCTLATMPFRPADYWIDARELSIGEYRSFLQESPDRARPAYWHLVENGTIAGDFPLTDVPVEDARACAEWLGKRLAHHAEWEWSARGPEGRLFPWGDEPPHGGSPSNSNGPPRLPDRDDAELIEEYLTWAEPVDSRPGAATPEGMLNAYGNVSETTGSAFAVKEGQRMEAMPYSAIVLGGTWSADAVLPSFLHHGRIDMTPADRAIDRGFRLARSAAPR